MSVQVFKKKSDFELKLNLMAKGNKITKSYDANAHSYFHFFTDRNGVKHYIGFCGVSFSRFGVTFSDELNKTIEQLKEIGQEGYIPSILKRLAEKGHKIGN